VILSTGSQAKGGRTCSLVDGLASNGGAKSTYSMPLLWEGCRLRPQEVQSRGITGAILSAEVAAPGQAIGTSPVQQGDFCLNQGTAKYNG
jgi:hypothetical protein